LHLVGCVHNYITMHGFMNVKLLDFSGMCVELLWSNHKQFLRLCLCYKHQTRQGIIKNGRRSSCEASVNYVCPR